ncbi:hypothetical protein BSZ21_04775 [Bradyrhizobium canariense]|nr:hypothetical protein BSZ21_04775 [Bradyrhizobium canariense]
MSPTSISMDPRVRLSLAEHRFALAVNSARRHHGMHHRRHKLHFFRFKMTARCFSQAFSPSFPLRSAAMLMRYFEHIATARTT